MPTDTSYWNVLAAAGTNGSDGSSGSGSSSGSGKVQFTVAGSTSAQLAGNAGYRAMNAACKSDYGETARMASSVDVAFNPPSATVNGMVWIQGIAHPSDVGIDDTTGLDLGTSNLTCNGWTSTSGMGLGIHGYNFSLNKHVACGNSLSVLCSVEDGVEQDYEFIGFSTTTTSGGGGYLGMANACRSDFGSTARIATTHDIIESNLDTTLSGRAWVQGKAHASNPAIDSASGVGVSSGQNLTCDGWSNSGSPAEGLIVNGTSYSISYQPCYVQSAVACSVPE